MNTVKSLGRRCVLAALLLAAACFTPKASADLLTNAWFKLALTAKGHTLANNITVKPLNMTRTVYLNISTNIPANYPTNYYVKLWTKVDGAWANSYTAVKSSIGSNENFFSDLYLQFRSSSNSAFGGFHTAFINVRTNSSGRLRTATYSGSGEVVRGDLDGKNYFGGYSLIGMTVRPSSLPFTP